MFRRILKLSFHASAVALLAGWITVQGMGSAAIAATPQQVAAFLANPGAVLQQNPSGGNQLVSLIRDLIMTDPATLNAIIGLLSGANTAQQSAIGTALGQAAQAGSRSYA